MLPLNMHKEHLSARIDRRAGRHSPQLAAGGFNWAAMLKESDLEVS